VRRFVIAATDYMDVQVIPALVERIARYAPGVDIHAKQTETPFPVKELEYNDLDVVLGFETILKPPGEVMSKQGGGLLAASTRFHNVLRDSAFRALERRQLDTELAVSGLAGN
jgi:hypothetical protein